MICAQCTHVFEPETGQTTCPQCGAEIAAAPANDPSSGSGSVKLLAAPNRRPKDGDAEARTTSREDPAASSPGVGASSRFDELGFLFDRKRPPTIALVGKSDVGKTFFLTRLEHIAIERGMKLRQRTKDGSVDFAPGAARPWEKDVQSTAGTVVYSLGRSGRKDKESLWIIDMRGEVFRKAYESHFRDAREEEVQDFWMILAAAQAFIVMTPAASALNLVRTEAADDLWDLSRSLEPLSAAVHLLDRRIAQRGGVRAAVEALLAMAPDDLGDELDRPRDRCRKPALVLLTQADLMRSAARAHSNPNVAAHAEQLDADPMLVMGVRSRATFNQLLGWFDYFKIDFVTACDGHGGGTRMDTRRPGYGVWEALDWTARTIKRTRKTPSAVLWRTRYAVACRKLLDTGFNRSLRVT